MASKAKPIPDGYHSVSPYLVCRNAGAAIEFYKKALGAQELFRMPGPGGMIMHAEIKIGDSVVMLCEENPDFGTTSPQALGGTAVNIFIYTESVDSLFDQAIKAGATTLMPPTDMFWGDRYSKLSDPFGHQWSIATHVEDLTPEEIGKRGAAAMAQGA